MRRRFPGLKLSTEDKEPCASHKVGRGAFVAQRSRKVTDGGALRSENVGMSNRNRSEILLDRKPKVSLAMAISQGLGGPKPNPEREG